MIIRWDDMRAERALLKDCENDLEYILKNRIRGSTDIKSLLKEFESQFAQYIGSKYAFTLNSGTEAFELCLNLLKIGKGNSIIVPNITYPTIPLSIINRGAVPILVDIKEEDLNINEDLIAEHVKKNTKAIVATHMFGRPCSIEKILKIAKKYNLYVIEDVSQAFGSTYKSKELGSFGDFSIFSFSFHKSLSTCGGYGGILCCNNSRYKNMAEDYTKSYFDDVSIRKRNKRFSNINFLDLISLRVKFKYLEFILQSREKIKSLYESELVKIKKIRIFEDNPYVFSSPGINFLIFAENRDKLYKWLNAEGISLVPWQYPCSVLHKMKFLKEFVNLKYPISEIYYKKALYLPLFTFMKKEEVIHVVNLIKRFYENVK